MCALVRRHGPDQAHACQLLLQSGAAGADRPECMRGLTADLRAAGQAGTVLCDPCSENCCRNED